MREHPLFAFWVVGAQSAKAHHTTTSSLAEMCIRVDESWEVLVCWGWGVVLFSLGVGYVGQGNLDGFGCALDTKLKFCFCHWKVGSFWHGTSSNCWMAFSKRTETRVFWSDSSVDEFKGVSHFFVDPEANEGLPIVKSRQGEQGERIEAFEV